MSTKRSQPVTPPKDKRAAQLFVGVITAEQQRKMQKAQDRKARIESGVRQTGSGVHGGGKKELSRRTRRQGKLDVKSGF
jgi:hypothetical protein